MINNYHELLDVDLSADIIKRSEITVREFENFSEKDVFDFVTKSGLKVINSVIEHEMQDISDEYFFEFSILGTTLDSDLNKLFCFTGIKGSEDFKDKIEGRVKFIIDEEFSNDNNNNFFHNPEFFIAPKELNILHIDEDCKSKIISEYSEFKKSNVYKGLSNISNFYSSNMTYERSFKDILTFSKNIYDNYKGDPGELFSQYKSGVEKLKGLYDKYIANEDERFSYLSLPLLASKNIKTYGDYLKYFGNNTNDNRIQGIGNCFIYYKVGKDQEPLSLDKVNSLHKLINDIVLFISFNYVFNIGIKKQEILKKEAIKSAKAAIISRNQSHNIGSHVLYYLRQKFNGEVEQLKELLKEINVDDSEIGAVTFKHSADPAKLEIPYLRGVGSFLTYIQERQDFIAAIATDQVPSYTTVNFKSFVIDNFTKDMKAKRHNVAKNEVNILLSYLTKSEDKEVEITYNGQQLSKSEPLSKSGGEDTKEEIDIYTEEIDLPGGVLGRQAMYCILENIIRNAAKHGKIEGAKLIIDITLKKPTEGNEKWAVEYFEIEVTDNSKTKRETCENLKQWLKDDLIDSNTLSVIENHKGLKEIIICAMWLCGRSIADIDNEDRHKYINVELKGGESVKEGNLVFTFYVYQPKKLLIVDPGFIDENENPLEPILKEQGKVQNLNRNLDIEILKRYDIVVVKKTKDHNRNFDSNNQIDINAFRRYLEVNDLHLEKSQNVNYITYYKKYLTEKFDVDFQNLPKFLINIHSGNSKSAKKLKINDADLKSVFSIMSNNADYVSVDNDINIFFDEAILLNKEKKLTEPISFSQHQIIAFRRHLNENINQFFKDTLTLNDSSSILGGIDKAKNKYLSVESVTGDNGSFGMIVNNDIDDIWVLNQLEAAYAKILIIDERLFKTYKFKGDEEHKLDKLLEEYLNLNNIELINGGKDNDLKSQLNELWKCKDKFEGALNHFNPINRDISTKRFLEDVIKNFYKKEPKLNYKDPILFKLKNIEISSPNENFEYFDLFGEKISIEDHQYHFISIHQGVIDKYATKNNLEKENATQKIKELFVSKTLIKLVVHTGRGKPNYTKDKLPYRSLSDLDYAIRESKTVLIDYFNSASYE